MTTLAQASLTERPARPPPRRSSAVYRARGTAPRREVLLCGASGREKRQGGSGWLPTESASQPSRLPLNALILANSEAPTLTLTTDLRRSCFYYLQILRAGFVLLLQVLVAFENGPYAGYC
jgi:hypothetical protein